jgi:hypothetical protein
LGRYLSTNIIFHGVYGHNSHIVASCFIHSVAEAVRTSIVGVFQSQFLFENFVTFLHKVLCWSFALFLLYFLIMVPQHLSKIFGKLMACIIAAGKHHAMA